MKDLDKYSINDFLQDIDFRSWVLGKSADGDSYWESWLSNNPAKINMIEEAKSLVIATQIEEIDLSAINVPNEIALIVAQLSIKNKFIKNYKIWLGAALIFIAATFGWYINSNKNQRIIQNSTFASENNSILPIKINLSDGSEVKLGPQSKLEVAKDFGQKTRTVFLSGSASFWVIKNKTKPFIVNAGGLSTKVLGTRFRIRAFPKDNLNMVAVENGSVVVFRNNDETKDTVLLTSNQKVVYEKKEERLTKTIVDNPKLLVSNGSENQFNNTPIPEVFKLLAENYGIKIVFDEEMLKHCKLTAKFKDETLMDKITMICESIQAQNEVLDGRIFIYAKGCDN